MISDLESMIVIGIAEYLSNNDQDRVRNLNFDEFRDRDRAHDLIEYDSCFSLTRLVTFNV